MKLRHRYLVVQLVTEDSMPSEEKFRRVLWTQLQNLYGELGVSKVGFWVVVYHPESKAVVIRCQHDQVRALRATLATITRIGSTSLLLHVVGVSGTIRKAKTLISGLKDYKDTRRSK
ncbi:MAG: Rpp14/Pop5 family protein [Promethearchaeota archaeon]